MCHDMQDMPRQKLYFLKLGILGSSQYKQLNLTTNTRHRQLGPPSLRLYYYKMAGLLLAGLEPFSLVS